MVLSHGLRQWAHRVGGQELLTCRERLQWNAFAVGRLGGEVTVSEQPCFVRRWHPLCRDSEQLGGDGSTGHEVGWSPAEIHDGVVNFETHRVIDDGAEIFDGDRFGDRMFGLVVGCTDHLAVTVTAPGQQDALSLRPVVASGVAIDSRCVSEFSGDDDEGVIQHASICEVLNQDPDAFVVSGQLITQRSFDIGVIIEVTGIQGDIANAGFDQSSCEECLFAPALAVAIAKFRRFF